MALHVRDPETDTLVREFAKLGGVGLTEAVKIAVGAELKREAACIPLTERIGGFQDEALAKRAVGLEADKAFYDALSGQDDGCPSTPPPWSR